MYSGKGSIHPMSLSKWKSTGIYVLFLFLAGFIFQGCVVHNHGQRSRSYAPPAPVTFTFNDHHRHTVHNYYRHHPHHGRGNHWKYEKNARLDPRIQMQALPFDLIRQLPPAPRGTRYIYNDNQILLINVNTRLVLDFINIPVSDQHQDAHIRKPAPKMVDQIPSYEEQHPSQSHQPPSHSRAYEVAQGKPFTENEHPSSHGQADRTIKGKPEMGEDHPSSHSHDHKMGQGKPDKGEDHSSMHAQSDNGPGHKEDKGKPLRDDENSSPGKGYKENKGQPDKGEDHPSMHAQINNGPGHKEDKGKPLWDDENSSPGKGYKENKGQPDKSRVARMDKNEQGGGPKQDMDLPSPMQKGNQGGQKGDYQDDRPSRDKGKPAKDSLMAGSDESPQTSHPGKPDKDGSSDKGKHKEIRANFSEQDESSGQSFSQERNKGKPIKQDQDSSSKPSVQENMEPAQVDAKPKEPLQIAKVESGRGKGNSKNSGKPEKMKRVEPQQQTGTPDLSQHQESAPVATPPQPATTASFAPATFDNNQRTLIQSYYQNSRPASSAKGKGKGKSSRGPKSNTVSVVKNDILAQPTDPLPRDLESQLPPTPPNTRRAVYQQQVVLIQIGTNRVLDVIQLNN